MSLYLEDFVSFYLRSSIQYENEPIKIDYRGLHHFQQYFIMAVDFIG